MNDKRKAAIMETIRSQLIGLLQDHEKDILAAYEKAENGFEGEGKFSFPVALKVKISPVSTTAYQIDSLVTMSTKTTFTAGRIIDIEQPDMFQNVKREG